MDYFLKKSFTFWLIVLLIVINIAAIATMIYITQHRCHKIEHFEKMKCPTPRQYFIQELQLNEEQSKEFKMLHKQHRQQARVLYNQMIEKQSVLFEEIHKDNPDSLLINTLLNELGKLHVELQNEALQHYKSLQNICTPEQKKKLKVLYKDIIVKKQHFPMRFRDHHGQGKGNDSKTGFCPETAREECMNIEF